MNQMKAICTFMLLLIISLLISGCTDPSLEGYIVKVEDDRILVAKHLYTDEEFEKTKGMSVDEMKMSGLSLIYLSYRNTRRFKDGQKVEVWIKGGINDSYPQQAAAKKVEMID